MAGGLGECVSLGVVGVTGLCHAHCARGMHFSQHLACHVCDWWFSPPVGLGRGCLEPAHSWAVAPGRHGGPSPCRVRCAGIAPIDLSLIFNFIGGLCLLFTSIIFAYY